MTDSNSARHNSGSFTPVPKGPHTDPKQGGEIPIGTGGGYAPGATPAKNT